MEIVSCLLDTTNEIPSGSDSIGSLVAASGKAHLWEDRRLGVIDVIVVHCAHAGERFPENPFSREALLRIFCEYGVSSHYLIDREGVINRLVPEEMKAWHAGGSIMPEPDNRRGVNEFSIGIELLATESSGFTPSQYDSLADLCADIELRQGKRFAYVGHENIAGDRAVSLGLRKDRKSDPGPHFSWDRFFDGLEMRRKGSGA